MMDNKDNDLDRYNDERIASVEKWQKARKVKEEAERKAREEADRKITEEQRKEMIASRLAENSLHGVFPGSTYVNYDGIKRFNKSLGNFKKKLSDFNKKHRKVVVRAEWATIIAVAMLSLYNSGKAIKRQFVGRNYIKQTVMEEHPEIFEGIQVTSSGNLMYVDPGTGTNRFVTVDEIVQKFKDVGYSESVISIVLSDFGIDVDKSDFIGEWIVADKAAYEAYRAEQKNNESGRSR